LQGRLGLEQTGERIKINTRRFAKRQMTWWNRDKEITWFKADEKEKIIEFIERKISGH
jgi:tRNA dimethylallyltransferase